MNVVQVLRRMLFLFSSSLFLAVAPDSLSIIGRAKLAGGLVQVPCSCKWLARAFWWNQFSSVLQLEVVEHNVIKTIGCKLMSSDLTCS
jgi:hypothetical protein